MNHSARDRSPQRDHESKPINPYKTTRMKKSLLPLLLTACPLLAGTAAPTPPANSPQDGSGQGWTLDLEVLFLRTFQGNNSFTDEDFDFGGRAALGYQFKDGWFTKASYFGYHPGGSSETFEAFSNDLGGNALFDERFNLESSYVDWTVGRNFKPSPDWSLSPSLGLRWATFEENFSKHEDDGMGGIHQHNEIAGFVLGANFRL